jgi:hypothetical protein
MNDEVLFHHGTTMVRRLPLAPGEDMPWHRDPFHGVAVISRGDLLSIEYRDGGKSQRVEGCWDRSSAEHARSSRGECRQAALRAGYGVSARPSGGGGAADRRIDLESHRLTGLTNMRLTSSATNLTKHTASCSNSGVVEPEFFRRFSLAV